MLGLAPTQGSLAEQALSLVERAGAANPWALAIGLGVLAIMLAGKAIGPRFPGALLGLCLSGLAAITLGLDAKGVAMLGFVAGAAPHLSLPTISWDEFRIVTPIAVLIALVVMVQTAATTRAFPNGADGPDVNRDFIGVGAANVFSGFIGAFPVDASPPSTTVVAEAGCARNSRGSSRLRWRQVSPVCRPSARARAFCRAGWRSPLRRNAPRARGRNARRVDAKLGEFLLIAATALAILTLPIEQGVAVGVLLSVLHGVWTTTRARAIELERIPGTSIWWPREKDLSGECVPAVRVIAPQSAAVVSQRLQFSQSDRAASLRKFRRRS